MFAEREVLNPSNENQILQSCLKYTGDLLGFAENLDLK